MNIMYDVTVYFLKADLQDSDAQGMKLQRSPDEGRWELPGRLSPEGPL